MLRFLRRRPPKARATHETARRPRPAVEELEGRLAPALLGQQLFPADNAWNQKITSAPVAATSSAVINNIVSLYGDGRLHPDFGQDGRTAGAPLYGIPYNVVHGNTQAKVHVVIDAYASESDLQNAPIPANAVLEGDLQTGPTAGVNNRGDSHLVVWDEDNNVAYEFYRASRPGENSDGLWHADQETVWDMKTDTFRTLGWTSADAAGLSVLAGLTRPDEGLPASEGGQGAINHAVRFTLQNAVVLDQYLYPASHTANPGNTNTAVMVPMGARFRLKASVDISQMDPESKVVAQAMKDYGLILADNGSNFFFSGASYSVDANNQFALTWNDSDIQDTVHGLKSLHYSDFEMVDLTPVVTGLSAAGGAAGSTVTVVGQNFSGAAGRLQVLFGGTPATGVTVVDDGHVTAVVPAGSGTVDVRVQSGVSDPSASDYRNPVFGYGTSAVSAADRFAYTGSGVPGVSSLGVTASTSSPTAGAAFTLTVTAKDSSGNAVTGYRGTVHFTSTDPQAVLPADYTFVAADNGSHTFNVTLKTAGGQTVTATDTAATSVTGGAAETVGPAAAASLRVGAPASAASGSAFSVTVTAKDAYGNVATGYRGTVHFSSSDPQALLPADYLFSAADGGAHTFSVTFRTQGAQTVTAADTANGSLTGQAGLTVTPGYADLLAAASRYVAGAAGYAAAAAGYAAAAAGLGPYGYYAYVYASYAQAFLNAAAQGGGRVYLSYAYLYASAAAQYALAQYQQTLDAYSYYAYLYASYGAVYAYQAYLTAPA
jgi:hypothetical protein